MKIGLLTFPQFNNGFKHKLEPSVLYLTSGRAEDINIFMYENQYSDDIDIYLASIYTIGFYEFVEFSKKVGKDKIIAGGYHSTLCPEETKEYARIVITGLSSNVEKYFDKSIEGIFEGEFDPQKGMNRKVYDLSKNKQVHPDIYENDIIGSINIGIGCNFSCNFCLSPLMSKGKIFYKTHELINKEIRELKDKNCNVLFVRDESFTTYKTLEDVCSIISESGFRIVYSFATASSLTKEKILLLKNSRWHSLCIGAEQATSKLIKNKNFDKAIELCKESNIGIALSFIVDDSNTMSEIEKQFRIIKEKAFKYMPIKLSINFLKPFPGTAIFEQYKNKMSSISYNDFAFDYPLFSKDKEWCNEILLSTLKEYYHSKQYNEIRTFECNDNLHSNFWKMTNSLVIK